MDDQKRMVLAVVLSIVVLVVYQFLFMEPPKPLPDQEEAQFQEQPVSKERKTDPYVLNTQTAVEGLPVTSGITESTYRDARTLVVSTPLYKVSISELGAAISDFELKNYYETNQENSPLYRMVPKELAKGTLFFDLEGNSIPGLKDALYTVSSESGQLDISRGTQSVEFELQTAQGIRIKKIFTFRADSYLIDCDVVFLNGSSLSLKDSIRFYIPGVYNEEIKEKTAFAFSGPVAFINGKYTEIDPDDLDEKNTYSGNIDWIGFSTQYFVSTLLPKQKSAENAVRGKLLLSYADDIVVTRYIEEMPALAPGHESAHSFTFYLGPKSHKVLSNYEGTLKEVVNFGFFSIIAEPLLIGMNMLHDLVPNYGLAIILLTIIIKLIFWPLGTKSYKSMSQMKKVQPLMTEIRAKYKNDKQKMNQEVMAVYKTYKVNPASGCLPLLVQMPIFFALYKMLYQAIELRHAPFVSWISDLSAPERLFHFNFSIPFMQEPSGLPMLTLLMGASFFIQQKITPMAGADPTQAKIMMLMPIVMTVIFVNFPAGLVLYMFVNNIISMGQQYYIQKKFA
jgi:YidC/Oxa1 family membrane protein insertase